MLHPFKLLILLVRSLCYLICPWPTDLADSRNCNLTSISNHFVIDILQLIGFTHDIPSTSVTSTFAHDLNQSHTSSQKVDLTKTTTLPSIRQLIFIHDPIQLTVDPDNVDVFFYTFEAH